jgi:hypothetical protein
MIKDTCLEHPPNGVVAQREASASNVVAGVPDPELPT